MVQCHGTEHRVVTNRKCIYNYDKIAEKCMTWKISMHSDLLDLEFSVFFSLNLMTESDAGIKIFTFCAKPCKINYSSKN
jgi:hypothetical protein